MKWVGTLALWVIVLCVHGLAGCKEKVQPVAGPAPAGSSSTRFVRFDANALARLGVKVASVGDVKDDVRVHVPGTLEYNLERYAEVGPLVAGRVSDVFVRVSEPVKKGQRLGTLLVPSVADVQAEFVSARAAAHEAKLHAERENDLLAKQLTTVHEAHMASSQAVKTAASLAAAEARLRAMGVSIPTGGDVVQGAGTMTILSPIDGVVVRRDAVLGQFLEPSEIGFVVADPTELWATIQVFESDIPYFQVGVDVLVTVDAMPGREFPSKIALMETDVARATRALRARIPIGNKNGELRPGLFVRASVRIPSDDGESRIRVPSAAVQPLGEEDVVFIERGAGVFEVRPVRVGRRTTQVVEIVEGVSRSERLAVEGTFLLRGEITKQ